MPSTRLGVYHLRSYCFFLFGFKPNVANIKVISFCLQGLGICYYCRRVSTIYFTDQHTDDVIGKQNPKVGTRHESMGFCVVGMSYRHWSLWLRNRELLIPFSDDRGFVIPRWRWPFVSILLLAWQPEQPNFLHYTIIQPCLGINLAL